MEAIRVPPLQGEARLLVAGSGPDSSRLAGLADGMSVEFLGQVPWESLQHLYDQVDALVLASEYEGLPTVALEAVSRGCPVVGIHGIGLEPILACGGGIVGANGSEVRIFHEGERNTSFGRKNGFDLKNTCYEPQSLDG